MDQFLQTCYWLLCYNFAYKWSHISILVGVGENCNNLQGKTVRRDFSNNNNNIIILDARSIRML